MTIAPSDAAVAARSFPRRWRALFARAAGDDEHGDVLARSGANGLAQQVTTMLADAAAKLPGTVIPGATAGTDVLDRLESAATTLARVIESVPADSWAGEPIFVLTATIDETAALLRRAEKQIDEALAA